MALKQDMNILVTGASGFVGRALIARMSGMNYHVVALDQDLTIPFQINTPFDYVIHLAACNFTNVAQASLQRYFEVNVLGTRHLLEGVRTNRFIFLSTTKVYQQQGLPLREDSPLAPKGLYEQSKLQAEELIKQMLPNDCYVILRSTNIVGPGQADKALVPVFFKNALQGKPLVLSVPRKTQVQLLSVDDVIDALLGLIENFPTGGVYNMASPEVATIEDLALTIVGKVRSLSSIEGGDGQPAPFSKVMADKLMISLPWQAKIPLDTVLNQCNAYYTKAYAS